MPTVEPAPLLLCLDCSNDACCLGLAHGDTLLVEYTFHAPRMHARVVPEALRSLLRDYGATFADVAALAVATGPGSYTGLRIAVSAAKGLATALNIPVVGVNSLEALAASMRPWLAALGLPTVLAVQDARRDEVFAAAFRVHPWAELMRTQPVLLAVDSFTNLTAEQVLLCGPGAPKVQQWVPHLAQARCAPAYSSIAGVAWLGAAALAAHRTADVATLEPFYLKPVHITTAVQQAG